jgi:hypothetical protein
MFGTRCTFSRACVSACSSQNHSPHIVPRALFCSVRRFPIIWLSLYRKQSEIRMFPVVQFIKVRRSNWKWLHNSIPDEKQQHRVVRHAFSKQGITRRISLPTDADHVAASVAILGFNAFNTLALSRLHIVCFVIFLCAWGVSYFWKIVFDVLIFTMALNLYVTLWWFVQISKLRVRFSCAFRLKLKKNGFSMSP